MSFSRLSYALLVVCLCVFPLTASGASANGFFQFDHDGFTKTIEFNVQQISDNGRASGEMTFSGGTRLYEQDVDGEGISGRYGTADMTMKVDLDCLRLSGSKAVASGRVASASIPTYVGRRVVLVVEDVTDPKKADRFTWGVYGPQEMTWIPQDSEAPGEQGWFSTWQASDVEREDSERVPARQEPAPCQTFSLSAYDMKALAKDSGDIQVTP